VPRQKNQAERRSHLMDAAMKAVLERGLNGTRLRDIAEEASVTPASVLYYYPDIQELFTAVFEHGVATYGRLREERIADAAGAVHQLRACIRSGIPWPGEAEQTSRLIFELFPLAMRDKSAAREQRDFIVLQTELYRRVLESGAADGTFDLQAPAAAVARSFVALEDGYALDLLAGACTAEDIEERLLRHAWLTTRNPAFAPDESSGTTTGEHGRHGPL